MNTLFKISMLAIALHSMSIQAQVPVLSLDSDGNEITTMISDSEYQKITSLQADAFSQTAEDHLASAMAVPHLTLKGIMVGLEAQGSVGPTPLKIGAGVNQQFYFELKK